MTSLPLFDPPGQYILLFRTIKKHGARCVWIIRQCLCIQCMKVISKYRVLLLYILFTAGLISCAPIRYHTFIKKKKINKWKERKKAGKKCSRHRLSPLSHVSPLSQESVEQSPVTATPSTFPVGQKMDSVCMAISYLLWMTTTEQIFNLRIACEKHLQHQQVLYHVFIDFKKVFDRVWHAALWATMKYNINTILSRVIKSSMTRPLVQSSSTAA